MSLSINYHSYFFSKIRSHGGHGKGQDFASLLVDLSCILDTFRRGEIAQNVQQFVWLAFLIVSNRWVAENDHLHVFCPHLVSTRIPALRQTVVLLQCIMLKVGMSSRKPAKSQSTHTRSSISNGLKEIHIDEEVKIAVNLSLERFRYSDHKGINCSFCIYIYFF